MSIWADINRRSQGIQKRKEDKVQSEPEFEFPWVLKNYAGTISNNIIPVQAMSEPTGKLFYTDFNFKP